MAGRRRRRGGQDEVQDLNLAPIMNMVMILIPLLLLSIEYTKPGVINISSASRGQSTNQETPPEQEQEPVPRVVVLISEAGFRIADQRNLPAFAEFSAPIERCRGAGDPGTMPTICPLAGVPDGAPLVQRLDFAALYNRLVQIRLQPAWYDRFGEDNNDVVFITADPGIPYEVLLKTIDVSRYILQPANTSPLPAPSASVAIEGFLLGGGNAPTLEDFETARFLLDPDDSTKRFTLFPKPMLQVAPAQGG